MSRPATSAMRSPTRGRAGEADHVDVGRGDERLAGLGAAAGDDVDDAGREAGLLEQLGTCG